MNTSRVSQAKELASAAGESAIVRGRDESRHRRFLIISTALLLLLDFIALFGSYWLALRAGDTLHWFDYELKPLTSDEWMLLGIAIAATFAAFLAGRLYVARRGISRMDDATRVVLRVTFGAVVGLAGASFLIGPEFVYSRRELVFAWLLASVMTVSARFVHAGLMSSLRTEGFGSERLLVVGAGRTGQLILDKIRRSPQLGYEAVGFVRHRPWPEGEEVTEIDGLPILGGTNQLAEIVETEQVDEIIVALSGVAHEEILDVILAVTDLPVSITVYPDTFRLLTSDVLSISDLNGLPTVRVRSFGLRPVERMIKRGMDVVVSVSVLVIFSPLMLLFAALVKLSSPGPVFYIQERVGRDGRTFQVLKFRSMPVDAEMKTGPVFTRENDDRPTRVGRFMRRYSVDELPQFINVLFGEMSVVGPRPERPVFVEQFRQMIPSYMARHHEKSGITGWAQVNGLRGDTSIEERSRYDLYYVENWSILFDIKIMIKTLLHIFRQDNAY